MSVVVMAMRERETVRMLNELGVAQANEVGRLYLGVRLTANNKQPLVKVSPSDFTAPFPHLSPYRGEVLQQPQLLLQ